MTFIRRSLMAAFTCAAVLASSMPLLAQDGVVARVNGKDITEADVRLAEADIGNDLQSLPHEARRRVLVEYLIENQLFAEAAEGEKLGSGTQFDQRMQYWRRRALRDTYLESSIKGAIDVADARKLYEQQVASAKPEEEVRARHILLESQDKATEVYEKIAHGEDFARMAKEYSKDPGSKDDGGDLGYLRAGQTIPQFEEAAFKLQKGEVSMPVQTQFGWHLIKVEDRRSQAAPGFEAVKERLVASMVHRKAQEVAASLREKAKLEYVDDAIRQQVEQETKIRPAPR